MCFGKTWSAVSLTIMLISAAVCIYFKGSYLILAMLIFLASKELIQFLLYTTGLRKCNTIWNKFLTSASWVHICFQPFFVNLFFSALSRNKVMYRIPLFLSLIYALFNLPVLREIGGNSKHRCQTDYSSNLCRAQTCSINGKYHLAYGFNLKSADNSGSTPNNFTYNLLSFAPAYIIGDWFLATIHLLVAFLSYRFITNVGEGSAIWCVNSFWIGLIGMYSVVQKAHKKSTFF
jgi:hypothetical protein